jgi:hypothetical protein
MEKQIDINLDTIEQFKYDLELRDKYPYLTRLLDTKGTIDLFTQLHYVARHKLPQLAAMQEMNNPIIFAPINKIVESLPVKVDKPNNKVVIMIYLYILETIDIDHLPPELRKRALEYRQQGNVIDGKVIHYKHSTRYYNIVSLDTNRLEMADEMARLFYSNKLTIKNFNREQLIRVFGTEEANRVFPERVDEEVAEINQKISFAIEAALNEIINKNGWTYDDELIEYIHIPEFDIKSEFKKTFKFRKRDHSDVIDNLEISEDDARMMNWYSSFLKRKLSFYIPSILKDSDIKKDRVNIKLRKLLDIPDEINGCIYYINKIVDKKDVHNTEEDKVSRILKLKKDNPNIKNTEIALTVGCSKQYVGKILKEYC